VASPENLGYGRAMNLGFRQARSEYVVLSNADVVFPQHSISRLGAFLTDNPGVGVVGPQQVFPDGSWQRSYGDLPGIWSGIKDAVGITSVHNQLRRACWPRQVDRRPKQVPYLDGAVLVVRREAFLQVNGFDEDFFFYAEEADLCQRVRKAGWNVVFLPEVRVMHVRGGSTTAKSESQFVRQQVNSQCLLASKHLPEWKVRLYASLQVIHFQRLQWSYRMLQVLRMHSHRLDKTDFFGQMSQTWSQSLRQHFAGAVGSSDETVA
jgi:GT2 family glycosyltransferase